MTINSIHNNTRYPFPPSKNTLRNRGATSPVQETNMNILENFTSGFNGTTGNKLLDRMFRKADGVVWDLMTGKIGIQTDDGIASLEGEGDDARVNQNLFDDFGIPLPAFAQQVPVGDVKIGDIIYRNNRNNVAWVIVKDEVKNTFKLMKPSGETTGWTPPKVQMLGFDSGVMVLRSLVSMLPGGQADVGQMQSMLMPLMLMGDSDIFGGGKGNSGGGMMDKMMPFMLMQMMNGNSSGNSMSTMMPMMMMMKMFGSK